MTALTALAARAARLPVPAPGSPVAAARRLLKAATDDPRRAARLLALVVAGLAVLTGLLAYQLWRYQRTELATQQASAVAADSVDKLLSYNFVTVDHQVADTEGLLTGGFKSSYADLVAKQIAGQAKAQQVAVQTQVVAHSVVSGSPDEVVVLLYLNQQSEAAAKPDPTLTGSRLRVTLQRSSDKWLISDLTPV
jgi:Mce-associated membrane protein